jgi:preprotein translocase SecE subunit
MILFLKSSIEELKKLQFPSKKETYVTTITILVTIIIFSLAILLADFLISEVIELILDLRSL